MRGQEAYGHPPAPQTNIFFIPPALEDSLAAVGWGLFPGRSDLPLNEGFKVALSFFHEAAEQNPLAAPGVQYLAATANLIKAAWLLRTIKSGQEYQLVSQFYLHNPVEQRLQSWGWTVPRMVYSLEQVCIL